MLIAQITDTHISTPGSRNDTYFRTAEHLERAVAHLNALAPRPDVVVATGDLVERGHLDEYERLRELLEPLRMPVFLIPGNHDDRQNLPRAFTRHHYLPRDGGFIQYAVDDWPVRLVALDTLIPGESGGRLCADRLHWLDRQLAAAPDRVTVVIMHHPPFVTGMRKMDQMGLEGAEPLAEIIRRHPQVERIVCGHLHRPIVRRFAGTVACTGPATAHQIALELGELPSLSAVMEPPGCLLHLWLGDGEGLVSHVSVIGDGYPPFLIFDGRDWLRDAVPPPRFHPHRSPTPR
ncbi:MAG TPA: phosphodiesterase [Candidatus Methylomirabilis sp.]|nr:phosphodiesterase [Candidatus Methylomirabilis sp.]